MTVRSLQNPYDREITRKSLCSGYHTSIGEGGDVKYKRDSTVPPWKGTMFPHEIAAVFLHQRSVNVSRMEIPNLDGKCKFILKICLNFNNDSRT